MKYMGSKNRIAKYIIPILEKNREPNQWYIEPFVGGANMIDKMTGDRAGFDSNEYLITLLNKMSQGWEPPKNVTKEFYENVKNNKDDYEKHLVAYLGFQLAFGSQLFNSFRRDNLGKRNYSLEAYNNIINQSKRIKGIHFEVKKYHDINLKEKCLIYCDPPYKGTAKYQENKDIFDYNKYYKWIVDQSKNGHKVFCSEYNMPNDFICIWEKPLINNFSKSKSIEKLFIHESQFKTFKP